MNKIALAKHCAETLLDMLLLFERCFMRHLTEVLYLHVELLMFLLYMFISPMMHRAAVTGSLPESS